MIVVDIIDCHCCSRLALVGLGIMEAQVESVINDIGLIPNGLKPYKGRTTIPPTHISSATLTFIPSSPTSCYLILIPIGRFVVIVILLGFTLDLLFAKFQ